MKQTETQADKQVDLQVHTETVPPTTAEKPKPLLVEIQTQFDLPEVETSKVVTHTGSMEIVKAVG